MESNEPVFGDLNRLMEITNGLDERGLVLSLAAFADEALGDLLVAFMLPGDAANELVKQGFNAPLGTYSARIKAVFALGLITARQHENLYRLRKIRNEFAHSWETTSFDDQKLSSHIKALKFSPLITEYPETSIQKVRVIISSLLSEIRSVTHQVKKNGWSAKTLGSELIPGLTSDIKDPTAECITQLANIVEKRKNAKGDYQDYLLAQQERWATMLEIIRMNEAARRR